MAFLVSRATGQISEDEHEGVYAELSDTISSLVDNVFIDGFQAPPLFELFLRERAQVYAEKPWLNETMRFSLALKRDITPLLHAQIEERLRYGGNCVLEFAGPTGFGKSSSYLGLMERHHGLLDAVRRDGVKGIRDRIAIDIADLPHKLEGLGARDAIALDEQLELVGENARTHLSVLRNLEDTLRGTMISIYFASPGTKEGHSASQGILEAISVSPTELRDGAKGRMATKFLYSIGLGGHDPIPLGIVDLPWCTPETFRAYTEIKNENLERTKKLQFHATGEANDVTIKKLFENQALLARLRLKVRPTKADWKRYLHRYAPSMSTAEADATSSELEEMLDCLRGSPELFRTIWDFDPTPNMIAVAENNDDDQDGGRLREL